MPIKIIKYFLVLCSVLYILVYIFIALQRIFYPYELEWMEGGMVDHVVRLLSRKQLYTEPSIEFIPYIYTPLFSYVGMIISKIFGVGFFSLRLISFLASLGCFVIIFEFVRRETKSLFFAILSVGLFAATYRISGTWLDLARVDSLFLFFLLWGSYLFRFYESTLSLVVSGVLIFLSFFTKQTGIVMAIAMSVYCFIYLSKWKKFIFPVTVLLCFTLSTLAMDWLSQGWYSYYVFDLPKRHEILSYQIIIFWIHDFMYLSVAFTISLIYCLLLLWRSRRKKNGYYIMFFLSMIGTSWFSRLHSGGYDNVLLPAYIVVSIFFGLGIQEITTGSVVRFLRHKNALPQDMKVIKIFLFIVCIAQFHSLVYNPFNQLPSKQDLKAGDAFIKTIKEIKGEVFIPFHGYVSSLAGKNNHAHWMAIVDVLRSNGEEKKNKLWQQLVEIINSKQFEAIIIDNDIGEIENEISKNYIFSSKVFNSKDVFWPVTGWKTRPESIYKISR